MLEFGKAQKTFVKLDELALPYAQHLAEHLKQCPKQITSKSSSFLDACGQFNLGQMTQTKLVDTTVKLGFENVIDAFHVVNGGAIPTRFFVDERSTKRGILLTDELLALAAKAEAVSLPVEVESRWRLVETAWSLKLPTHLIAVHFDSDAESFYVETPERRINVTGCRDALNGYQKSKCFYCFRGITVDAGGAVDVDVDHVFPHGLNQFSEFSSLNLNGVWNLVLACSDCNRGKGGKHMRVASARYLERLHTRNQFFIESHHPLRETLINQTGASEPKRGDFLRQLHAAAVARLLHTWEATDEQPSAF